MTSQLRNKFVILPYKSTYLISNSRINIVISNFNKLYEKLTDDIKNIIKRINMEKEYVETKIILDSINISNMAYELKNTRKQFKKIYNMATKNITDGKNNFINPDAYRLIEKIITSEDIKYKINFAVNYIIFVKLFSIGTAYKNRRSIDDFSDEYEEPFVNAVIDSTNFALYHFAEIWNDFCNQLEELKIVLKKPEKSDDEIISILRKSAIYFLHINDATMFFVCSCLPLFKNLSPEYYKNLAELIERFMDDNNVDEITNEYNTNYTMVLEMLFSRQPEGTNRADFEEKIYQINEDDDKSNIVLFSNFFVVNRIFDLQQIIVKLIKSSNFDKFEELVNEITRTNRINIYDDNLKITDYKYIGFINKAYDIVINPLENVKEQIINCRNVSEDIAENNLKIMEILSNYITIDNDFIIKKSLLGIKRKRDE